MIQKYILLVSIIVGLTNSNSLWSQNTKKNGDFISLFNGKDLNDWVTMGTPGSFIVKENTIYTTGKHPYPSWLRSKKEYENFILRFSYKTNGWYEGGVLLHAPIDASRLKTGFKIHLRHDQHDHALRSSGAIYDVAAPLSISSSSSKEWNQYEVICNWPTLRVTMNDTIIHDIDMNKNPALSYRSHRGFIGIQNICNSGAYYKDIEIHPLPNNEKQWVYLFDHGIDSLELKGKSEWTIINGILTAKGNNAMAYTKKEFFEPFEMQVWVKNMINGNGGIVFNEKERIEIQCFNVEGSTNPTGSIYGIAPATRVVSRDMEWYLMQIYSNGKNVKVFINGEKVAETNKLKKPLGGKIGFQQHTPNGYIQYRGARIKKL